MNQQDSVEAALSAASEYSDYVRSLSDECEATLHVRLISLLLNLAYAMEELVCQSVHTDSDNDYQSSIDDYNFARSKFVPVLDRDMRRVVISDDATFSAAQERILMLDDDLSDIYSAIQGCSRTLDDSVESKLAMAENLVLTYEIHWADHLYRALYSVNQLRFGIIT